MPFREVDCISEFNHPAQKVGARAEALDDAGNLLSPRPGPPKVISRSCFSGGFRVFDDPDFRGRLLSRDLARCLKSVCRLFRSSPLPLPFNLVLSGTNCSDRWARRLPSVRPRRTRCAPELLAELMENPCTPAKEADQRIEEKRGNHASRSETVINQIHSPRQVGVDRSRAL